MRERLTWLARYRIIHICMPMYWVSNEILWNSVNQRISRSRWPCPSSEYISDICGFCHEHMTGCELYRIFTSVQLTQKWCLSYLVHGLRGLKLNVLPVSWICFPISCAPKVNFFVQSNNCYIFPGMGLGCVISGAIRVHDDMFLAAGMYNIFALYFTLEDSTFSYSPLPSYFTSASKNESLLNIIHIFQRGAKLLEIWRKQIQVKITPLTPSLPSSLPSYLPPSFWFSPLFFILLILFSLLLSTLDLIYNVSKYLWVPKTIHF